jgi:hypothetical protein
MRYAYRVLRADFLFLLREAKKYNLGNHKVVCGLADALRKSK